MAKRDPYEVLGVARTASADEIKSAYRRLARRFHPDVNPGDASAEESFKEVGTAYAVLSDPQKRARFDQTGSMDDGPTGFPGGGMGGVEFGGMGDLFDMFFGGMGGGQGGRRRSMARDGDDVRADVELTLSDVVNGVQTPVEVRRQAECGTCHGMGTANGEPPTVCPQCSGTGAVSAVRNTFIGQVRTSSPCPRCSGEGYLVADPCKTCGGDGTVPETAKVTLKVPQGVESGVTMQVPGQGGDGVRGGRPGDLYAVLTVQDDSRFERDGQTLYTELPLNYAQAALGDHLPVEGVDAEYPIDIEAGIQPGTEIRVKGAGLPPLHGGRRGDLVVVAGVAVPKNVSEAEAKLLRELAELRGEKVPQPKAGFLGGLFKKR